MANRADAKGPQTTILAKEDLYLLCRRAFRSESYQLMSRHSAVNAGASQHLSAHPSKK